MIVTRTPLRINFAAGGSDLPAYYRQAPGAVLGAAIDVYIHVCVKSNFDGRVLAHYRATEDVECSDDLRHDRMRACLRYFGVERGVEIASLSDVPGSTGLGSSGAFTVALLLALDRYTGGHEQLLGDPYKLARLAFHIESEACAAPVGKQDQLFAALGGVRLLQFFADETISTGEIALPPAVADYVLLVSTSLRRDASPILSEHTQQMAHAGTRAHVDAIVDRAYRITALLSAGDMHAAGRALDEVWRHKRQIAAGITNSTIDRSYAKALEFGAWGGKLCGAGGGGFLLFLAPPERHPAIIAALGLRHVPIRVGVKGCEIVYVS